eukprot:7386700-Prymnesium_polylepis.3
MSVCDSSCGCLALPPESAIWAEDLLGGVKWDQQSRSAVLACAAVRLYCIECVFRSVSGGCSPESRPVS